MSSKPRTTIGGVGLALALAGYAGVSAAAGFALIEQSGSGMGNAYAGSAASAEDASTIFFNPAGMSFLPGPQAVIAGHAVNVSSEFTDNGSTLPLAATGRPRGGNGGDAGSLAFIPNLYLSMPVGDRFSIGLGVSAPFGLKTEYDDTWVGRFQGIESDLKTINFNPSIAYKVSDAVSIGAGVNFQRAEATLTNAVMLGAFGEGRTQLEAEDDAWGWNVGAMFQLGTDMRIGVAYRSQIDYTLEGSVNTTTQAGAPFAPGSFNAEAEVTFPDSFSLSVAQKFGDKWDLLGDVTFTRWSEIQTINVVNQANGQTRDQLAFNFDDSWRVSFGLNYHLNEKWTLKSGVAWDQTPVNDQSRTVRLPDQDRFWVAFGAKWRFNSKLAFDVGYAHLFIQDADINLSRVQAGATPGTAAALTSTTRGSYEASVDILSLQLTYTF